MTSPFITHLHAFRGFAILTIVAAHSWSFLLTIGDFATMPGYNTVYSVVETLFHGSTVYFALISGLLFSLVLHRKGWRSFFRSKALNVLLPYAIISLVFLAAFWPFYVQWFEAEGMSTIFLVAYARGLIFGSIQLQFWYIPVLVVLYLLTPLIDWLLKSRTLFWVAWALAVSPLLVSRTIYPDLLGPATIVYFAGAYTIGMICGNYYEQTLGLVRRYLVSLWVAGVGSSAVLILLFLNEYVAPSLFSLSEMLFYAQKLSFAALVLHYFSRFEARLPAWLLTFGTYAFAIYFLHFFPVAATAQVVRIAAVDHVGVATAFAGGLFILVAALSLSLGLSWLIKKPLGRYSRMAIGA